jgi:hypothetical protein
MDKLGEIVAFIFTLFTRVAIKGLGVFFAATGLYCMYIIKAVTLQQSMLVGLGIVIYEIDTKFNYTPQKQ